MINLLKTLFLCKFLGDHDWTSAALQGIKPTPEQLESGTEGYNEYSRMYCARCGQTSKIWEKYKL